MAIKEERTGGYMKKKIIIGIMGFLAVSMMSGCSSSEYQYENVKEGELLELGRYHQETEVGKDFCPPIEWYVLKKENGQALLLSKYVLACVPYGDKEQEGEAFVGCVWRDSNLRRWLNEEFYEDAFTKEEQERILYTTNALYYDYEGNYTEYGEISTEDKISLLNEEDYFAYVYGKDFSDASATRYLMNQDENFESEDRDWELITPGMGESGNNAIVSEGEVYNTSAPWWMADGVHYVNVRPAIWIKLDGYEKH